jgi:hypothetical protein
VKNRILLAKDNRKILMKSPILEPNKRAFWCKKKYRGEGRNIVYNEESYLHSSRTSPYGWYDRGDNCLLKAPTGKGQRLIMVHCGCEKEFVSNARLMFKSRSKSGDYHDEMNHKNCEHMKLLPNLEENSVLVIDNVSYHNVQVDRAPTSVTKIADMQKWLNERGIFFGKKKRKQNPSCIKLYKPIHKNS